MVMISITGSGRFVPAQLRKLGAKLTLIAIIYLALAVAAIGVTLLASWQLEGGAAAINQLGSQRMRSWHVASLLALQLTQPSQRERLAQQAIDTMSTLGHTMKE